MSKKIFATIIVSLSILSISSGCSGLQDAELVNTETIPLLGISSIEISYGSDHITFFQGSGDNIIIKEYMSKNKEKYYAKVSSSSNTVTIQTGKRPTSTTFNSYVEVYLPSDYAGQLSVKNKSGAIKSDVDYKLSDLYIESTSGAIDLGNLTADNINTKTTSGSITCSTIAGNVSAETSSGKLQFSEVSGSGSFKADSSEIELGLSEITGNVTAYSKSGMLHVTAPAKVGFQLSATTKSGKINNSLSGNLNATERSLTGTVGDNPQYTIELTTSSGNIEVN